MGWQLLANRALPHLIEYPDEVHAMSTLFDPIQIGALKLPNRIIMAPLTRMRAFDERARSTQRAALRAARERWADHH